MDTEEKAEISIMGGESQKLYFFRSYWAWLTILLLAMVLVSVLIEPLRINHDCALFIDTARHILDGKLPYADFFEINPPLMQYLAVPPVWLADITGVHPVTMFNIFIVLSVVVSSLLAVKITSGSRLSISTRQFAPLIFGWTLFSYLLVLYGNLFGQREHLFLLLFFPFFVLRWIRMQGGKIVIIQAVFAGVLAGIGLCLKPYFLLYLIMTELFWLLTFRKWRLIFKPEVTALVLAGFGYALHFLFIPKRMFNAFFMIWLPFLAKGYDVYNGTVEFVLFRKKILFFGFVPIFITMTAIYLYRGRCRTPLIVFIRQMGIITVVCIVTYLIQFKGFAYHLLPSTAAFFLIVFAIFAQRWCDEHRNNVGLFQAIEKRAFSRRLLAALTGLIIIGLPFVTIPNLSSRRYFKLKKAIENHSTEGDVVMVISTSVNPAYPALVQMKRLNGSRHLWTFTIPMLYLGVQANQDGSFPYRRPEEWGEMEARFVDEIKTDLHSYFPRLILLDNREKCQACPKHFNVVDYLQHVGIKDLILAHYDYIGIYNNFELFKRKS